jgi:uncharacterized protein
VTALERIHASLATCSPRIIACSGGVDSLLLATLAHRADSSGTVIAHALSAAVPREATERVVAAARAEGWTLELVHSGELDDDEYLRNPTDRCYHCKRHLYETLDALAGRLRHLAGWVLLSGANTDDLGEYRPGLLAAAEHGARHPFVEAEVAKRDIRAIATQLGLPFSDLPASPCLASRLYTGTRVTERLRAVELGEAILRASSAVAVLRCRVRDDEVRVEVEESDRAKITTDLLDLTLSAMRLACPSLIGIRLDERPYRPGRAVLAVTP